MEWAWLCCCIAELKEYAKCLLATGKKLAARTPEQKGADADDPSRVVELSSQDLMLRSLPLPTSVRASKLVNRQCYDKLMDIIEQRFTHPLWSLVLTGDLDQPNFTHALLVCAHTRVISHPTVHSLAHMTVAHTAGLHRVCACLQFYGILRACIALCTACLCKCIALLKAHVHTLSVYFTAAMSAM